MSCSVKAQHEKRYLAIVGNEENPEFFHYFRRAKEIILHKVYKTWRMKLNLGPLNST